MSVIKELKEIVKAYDRTLKQGRRMALASVVHVEGSSYRRPGARMLVDDEGNMTGAISGGCLEGDALRKAQLVIAQQYPKLVSYDTSDEDDVSIGVQLGCAGVINVLFEPIGTPHNVIELIRKIIAIRQKVVMVTLFNADRNAHQYGTCLLLEDDGNISGDISSGTREQIAADARVVLAAGKSDYKTYIIDGAEVMAFFEFIPPPVSLVVVGAGNDAIPLVNIANELGWEPSVIDGRSTHAKTERFVGACQVLVSKPDAVLEKIGIDERTVFVLMTHNYNYDLAMLRALLMKDPAYIGVLGPKKKLDRMIGEIREGGMIVTREMMEKVYGPVGLDIGAETAEEIALSIIAEINAILNHKDGTSLREKKGSIHTANY